MSKRIVLAGAVLVCALAGTLQAQTVPATAPPLAPASPTDVPPLSSAAATPVPMPFAEAIRRALANNPSVAVAAANILQAQGLLLQARAATLPNISVDGSNATLDGDRVSAGQLIVPQNTFFVGLTVAMPLFAPAQWAQRAQALDAQHVAEASSVDVKRQIAEATGQAYLSVIAARRVVESQLRARDTAQAFFDYADNRLKAGAGSKLTALQAQQTLSADEAFVEQSRLALYRAQEALGILVATEGPVDAQDEPVFEIPDEATVTGSTDQVVQQRTDIKLANLQVFAAQRIVSDSWKDWLPSVTGVFQPAYQHPGLVSAPTTGWRALLQFDVPVFDSGNRRGVKVVREASLQSIEAIRVGQLREAKTEIRRAYESVRRGERVLASSRDAAAQAAQVLDITQVSFRAGAATNLDVIDAQRRARDADTAVAIAEDNVRQSRLDLLTALGRFP